MTVLVVSSLLIFVGLYYCRPRPLQYTGPDKRANGTVNSLAAIGFALATACLLTLVVLIVYVWVSNQSCAALDA